MAASDTPTLRDLARLIETASGGDYHPEAADTARWLIEETAAELYAELVAESSDQPSTMDMARLLCAVTSDQEMPEALDTAHWLIARSEPARAHLARLEQLAADTGKTIDASNRMTVLNVEYRLQRLVEAADDWQDPSDVLDPTRFQGFSCRALYSLCCAWIERSEGDERRQLETVCEKLKRPAELERLLPLFDRRFELLRQWLCEVEDPETAADSLEDMRRLLRSALGRSRPTDEP